MTSRLAPSSLVLVCTYNERENLPNLLEAIRSASPDSDVLIVDDHSPDGTADWVRLHQKSNPRVALIERSGKLGLGTAIRTGMNYAIEHRYDWLVNLDGDLSHDPAVIPQMVSRRDAYDLVIGSRYVSGGGLQGCSWRRIAVSRFANWLARRMVGWSIRDCSSAYRMYRVSMLETIDLDGLQETGYGFLEEILAHLLKSGARVTEVPIIYQERRLGQSKISLQEARSAFSALLKASAIHRSKKRG
jgi:dolichol-phosphate mannosyltransferase